MSPAESRSRLPWLLTTEPGFPDPRFADQQGLVAIGADFSVDRLVAAYCSGIFPWSADPITWWSPDPRGIIELDSFHVPRSLNRLLRKSSFTITVDRAFDKVISACAEAHSSRESTWISSEFIEAYGQLHRAGHAHSLEVWNGTMLSGGIYGVAMGGLFAGESMFHRESGASKVALVRLVEHLKNQGFTLFDVQMLTPVTRQMGGIEVSRDEYLRRLELALEKNPDFSISRRDHDCQCSQ